MNTPDAIILTLEIDHNDKPQYLIHAQRIHAGGKQIVNNHLASLDDHKSAARAAEKIAGALGIAFKDEVPS